MPKLTLNQDQVTRVRLLASNIARGIQTYVDDHSSLSVERAILRLYGVDGVVKGEVPLPNAVIEKVAKENLIENGISNLFARAMVKSGRDAKTTAELIAKNKIDLKELATVSLEEATNKEAELTREAIKKLDDTRNKKLAKRKKLQEPKNPWRYLIVATGNIYEDRTQAIAAVKSGADIIAVIRSTAQSLLDYVPYGPTTEGYGGTYATQANFKIMREALDEAMEKAGRYIRLVNYSSGLCMAEIAACAAMEDLDMLLNDSMYGILFRDINQKRTFIDQFFSRLLCSRAKIIINTGEDNYLTTSDAIEKAYTVTASQLINQAMGHNALLTDDLLGLGHAFEINPQVENSFLYELSHAQLARELFPTCPLKYMPPTKHKSTDIFFSHCMDTMFNLASVTTNQGIHLAGILTEAIHTPLMQDRAKSLKSINYIFNTAKDLGDEIEFKRGGLIEKRASIVLNEVEAFLNEIQGKGLMQAISEGRFAQVKREIDGGKGLEGVFKKGPTYKNPIMDQILAEGVIRE